MSAKAAEMLADTIDATGGVVVFENGMHAPYCDPDWIDLGDAYMAACAELGRTPKITPYKNIGG